MDPNFPAAVSLRTTPTMISSTMTVYGMVNRGELSAIANRGPALRCTLSAVHGDGAGGELRHVQAVRLSMAAVIASASANSSGRRLVTRRCISSSPTRSHLICMSHPTGSSPVARARARDAVFCQIVLYTGSTPSARTAAAHAATTALP